MPTKSKISKAAAESGGLRMASALRARRKRMGLTLQELADKSGLSAPFLSQVECDHTTPSIASLNAIAQALEVDIQYFISPPPPSEVVRRASDPELHGMRNGIRYERLTGKHGERQLEALLMVIPPGASTPATTRGEGFYYVFGGKLTVTLGGETFILGRGDSVHFDQRHPYKMANLSKKKSVRVLWVATPAIS